MYAPTTEDSLSHFESDLSKLYLSSAAHTHSSCHKDLLWGGPLVPSTLIWLPFARVRGVTLSATRSNRSAWDKEAHYECSFMLWCRALWSLDPCRSRRPPVFEKSVTPVMFVYFSSDNDKKEHFVFWLFLLKFNKTVFLHLMQHKLRGHV